jgi:hypothetical protein
MAEEIKNKGFWWQLRHRHYRLVLLDHETLEQKGAWVLTLTWFYTLVSSLLLFFAAIVVALIVLTPLKTYIPGYTGRQGDRPVYELTKQVKDLEAELKAQQVYIDNFRKLMTGNVQRQKDVDPNYKSEEQTDLDAHDHNHDHDDF